MAFVLDFDPAVLRQGIVEELLADDGAGGAQGLAMRRHLITTMLPDHVGGFETIAADIEVVTRHTAPTPEIRKFSFAERSSWG